MEIPESRQLYRIPGIGPIDPARPPTDRASLHPASIQRPKIAAQLGNNTATLNRHYEAAIKYRQQVRSRLKPV